MHSYANRGLHLYDLINKRYPSATDQHKSQAEGKYHLEHLKVWSTMAQAFCMGICLCVCMDVCFSIHFKMYLFILSNHWHIDRDIHAMR